MSEKLLTNKVMEARELRIGNYYSNNGKFEKVTPNVIEALFESTERIWIKPIELTEDILLKCPQFKKSITGHGWFEHEYFTDCKESAEKMIISYNVHSGRFSVGDADEETYPAQTAKVIKHLHRFQNLFIELTDVELEINI